MLHLYPVAWNNLGFVDEDALDAPLRISSVSANFLRLLERKDPAKRGNTPSLAKVM